MSGTTSTPGWAASHTARQRPDVRASSSKAAHDPRPTGRLPHLIFNEGHAATAGYDVIRLELIEEALRLGRILAELLAAEPEAAGRAPDLLAKLAQERDVSATSTSVTDLLRSCVEPAR
jgi:hypothetical protein